MHQTEGMLLLLSVEAVVSLDFTRALRVDGLRKKGLTTTFESWWLIVRAPPLNLV